MNEQTLYSKIAKNTKTKGNASDWMFNIHHAMWYTIEQNDYGIISLSFSLDNEPLFPIGYILISICIVTKTRLNLDESY